VNQPTKLLTPADLTEVLKANFAPWIQALNLTVEQTSATHTTLRLPWSPTLAREGGALSGQALMAAADTATALALTAARGAYLPMTTIEQHTTFQRPIIDTDTLITARITKLGRTMAFADIAMTAAAAAAAPPAADAAPPPTDPLLAAHATAIYAIL